MAEATCLAALERRESRGAHQRLEPEYQARNDEVYLKHSLVHYQPGQGAVLSWQDVDISLSPPGVRAYGEQGKGVSS